MRRLHRVLSLVVLLLLSISTPAFAQSIFVSNDEHFTSADGLGLVDDTQLTLNIAAWLTAQSAAHNILILSNNAGLNNTTLVTKLTSAGYTVTGPTATVPVQLVDVNGAPLWDAIFVSGDCRFDQLTFGTAVCANGFKLLDMMLVNYVNAGGNVFVEVGLVCNTGDPIWNSFLNVFGLNVVHGCNGILNSNVNVSTFQTLPPYGPDLFTGVNTVYIDNGENLTLTATGNAGAQVFIDPNGNGLYGAWRPNCGSGQQLLVNGGFETGDFTGWTTGGNFEFTDVVTGPFYAYSGAQDGNFYAVLGPVGSDGTLSQTFSDTAGSRIDVCFWMASIGDQPSDFKVYWDGTLVFGRTNPNTGAVWTQFGFRMTGLGSDSLSFAFRDDPGYIALDHVVVTPN